MKVTVSDVAELIHRRASDKNLVVDADTVLLDAGLSSLQIADVVYTVEDDLGIELDPSRAADVATVGDLVELANATALATAAAAPGAF